jgi:hypothetical protein
MYVCIYIVTVFRIVSKCHNFDSGCSLTLNKLDVKCKYRHVFNPHLIIVPPLFFTAKQMSGAQSQFWNAPPPQYQDVMSGNAMPAPQNYYTQPQNYYGWTPPAYNFPSPDGKHKIVSVVK